MKKTTKKLLLFLLLTSVFGSCMQKKNLSTSENLHQFVSTSEIIDTIECLLAEDACEICKPKHLVIPNAVFAPHSVFGKCLASNSTSDLYFTFKTENRGGIEYYVCLLGVDLKGEKCLDVYICKDDTFYEFLQWKPQSDRPWGRSIRKGHPQFDAKHDFFIKSIPNILRYKKITKTICSKGLHHL